MQLKVKGSNFKHFSRSQWFEQKYPVLVYETLSVTLDTAFLRIGFWIYFLYLKKFLPIYKVFQFFQFQFFLGASKFVFTVKLY